MKKLLNLVIIIILFLLNSCVMTWDYYFEDINAEDIKTISFYDISDEILKNDNTIFAKDPFYILDGKKNYEFFEKLKELKYSDGIIFPAANDPNFDYGDYVVKMEFTDLTFRLISYAGYNEYFDEDQKRIGGDHYSCDKEAFINLIKYYSE